MNLLRKIEKTYSELPVQARASAWYLVCSFLQKGISVISTPIFTRLLTTSEYGAYSVYNSWYGIIAVFVTLRLYYGVYSQAIVKYNDERDSITAAMIGLTCTLTAAWLVLYLPFSEIWNRLLKLTTSQIIAMTITIWTEAIFSFWAARQRVEYSYKRLVTLTVIVSIAKPLFGIVAVLFAEDKVTARVWELAIVELIAYFGLFISQTKNGNFYSYKVWRYALLFNIPLIPHYLSQTLLNSSDRIMIERYAGPGPAGIYALAVSVAQLMTLFNTAINQTIAPWTYQKIKDGQTESIKNVAYPSVILVGVLNILLICFAPEAVSVFAPAEYYEAIWTIPPVAMSVFFVHLYNLYSSFEFYFEKPVFIAFSTACAAITNIGLNLLLIPKFGYIAAGYTTLISYAMYAIAHAIFSRAVCLKEIRCNPLGLKRIGIYSTGFSLFGLMVTLTYNLPLLRWTMIAAIIVAAVLFRDSIVSYIKLLANAKKSRG